ncbi:site-specific integrase [Lactococcus lactis]|nr:site-specific integrase [Lactococcus lactis]
MQYRTTKTKKGIRYDVVGSYKDPLTGKRKRATVSYYKDSPRLRKQAERDLEDKIYQLVSETEVGYNPRNIVTFGELKDSYIKAWELGVKPKTVEREKLILSRVNELLKDDYLLEKITPFLIKNILTDYVQRYDPMPSSLGHVRSTMNKIFAHGVEYGIIKCSPMGSVKVVASPEKKAVAYKNREKKFLDNHELQAAFELLRKRENPNYYDLAIFLAFSGLRIGEVSALFEEDFDGKWIDVSKSLQYHYLRVDDYYIDSTKTEASVRELQLPRIAIDALNRAIVRSHKFDKFMIEHPAPSFRKSKSIFRTKIGTPITSKNFRMLLNRVEKELLKTCEEKYGFKWTKHLTPHGFRHDNSTMMQDAGLPLKEVSGRLGHRHTETTMIYIHRTRKSQQKAVDALNQIAASEFQVSEIKSWTTKYTDAIYQIIKDNQDTKQVELSLDEFRDGLGLKQSYPARYISGNILPKIKLDLKEEFEGFKIETLRKKRNQVIGYQLSWK